MNMSIIIAAAVVDGVVLIVM